MNTEKIKSRESNVESPEREIARTASPNREVSYQFVVTVGQLAPHAKDYRVANCIMAAVRDELRQPRHGYGAQVHVAVKGGAR